MLQDQALKILNSGVNTFLTGEAGSGKTFVLNEFINSLRREDVIVAITASTGIAATHLGGKTVHSWSGLGINQDVDERLMNKILRNKPLTGSIEDTEVLIIDEISMLDGARLNSIDQIVKTIKKSHLPFGGIQVILSGDFFQLPPISNTREKDYAFNSSAWREADLQVCYLEEQHRQDDDILLSILQAIRNNTVEDYHREYIASRINEETVTSDNHTKLFTHNVDVDKINQQNLDAMPGDEHNFTMKVRGDKRAINAMIKGCLAPQVLSLKEGAEVMFVANNFAKHYVNGTRGKVVGFDDEGQPIVKVKRREITLEPHKWKLEENGDSIAELIQFPLRLAWAITVHKSQGMSLDDASIDLSRAFEPGMGYVALSRVKSLAGLNIIGINDTALIVDPEVLVMDKNLRLLSAKGNLKI